MRPGLAVQFRNSLDTMKSLAILLLLTGAALAQPPMPGGNVPAGPGGPSGTGGTSFLTSLTLDESSVVKTAKGGKPTMTVDGVVVPLKPGSYRGNIVVG